MTLVGEVRKRLEVALPLSLKTDEGAMSQGLQEKALFGRWERQEMDSPQSLQKEPVQPAPSVSLLDLFQISDLQSCEIVSLGCLKSQCLW